MQFKFGKSFAKKKRQAVSKYLFQLAMPIFSFGISCGSLTFILQTRPLIDNFVNTNVFLERQLDDMLTWEERIEEPEFREQLVRDPRFRALQNFNLREVEAVNTGEKSFVLRKKEVGYTRLVGNESYEYLIVDESTEKEAKSINAVVQLVKDENKSKNVKKLLIPLGAALLGMIAATVPCYYSAIRRKREIENWLIKNKLKSIKIFKDSYDVHLTLEEDIDGEVRQYDAIFEAEKHFKNIDDYEKYASDMEMLILECGASLEWYRDGYVTLNTELLDRNIWSAIINENAREVIPISKPAQLGETKCL